MQVAGLVSSVLRQNSIRTENSAIPGTLDTPACELLQKQPSRKEVHAGYTPGTRRVHAGYTPGTQHDARADLLSFQ
jgi:hypothetical protein